MKTGIVFMDGIKQVIFTPENDDEKKALSLFSVDDDISIAIKNGDFFGSNDRKAFRAQIGTSQGGFLRLYEDNESTMFVLTPKRNERLQS